MKVLWRLVPVALVELVARLAGYAVGVIWPHGAYKAERVVRGRYWARRLSGSDLWIGRNVQLEGDRISLGARVHCSTEATTSPAAEAGSPSVTTPTSHASQSCPVSAE